MHYCCRVYSRIHPSSCHHRLPMYVLYLFLYVTTLAPAYSSLFSTRGAAHEANKTNNSSSCTYGALASFSFGHLSLVVVTQSGIPPVRSSPIVYSCDMPVTSLEEYFLRYSSFMQSRTSVTVILFQCVSIRLILFS